MRNYFLKSFPFLFIILLNYTNCFSQFVDFNRKVPYQKVFVDTDNFGLSYLDILEESYPTAKEDTIQFSMLNDLAYYWHTRNLNTALVFTHKGLELTSRKNNKLWEGRFQITQGAILLRMEKLASALEVLEEAKSKVKEEDLAFLNTQLGYVYERQGELKMAANFAIQSLKHGGKLDDKKAIALAYSDLSNLFWKQSKYVEALELGLKSLKIFEERGIIDLDYDFTLYVVGNNYLALNNTEKALDYYSHSVAIGERYGFYNNLSDVYISLVELYSYSNKFDLAGKAGVNAIKYAELLDNSFMLMRSWLSVGKFQYLQGKYISAIESLQKSITIASDDFGDVFYLSQAYESLGKAYAGNHNYKEAYLAFEKYDRLKNKIFTAESDYRITQIKTEFDVASKENTIQIQESQIKKQRSAQIITTIIAVSFLLLLLLLFVTFQNNRRKTKLLQEQNQEKEFLLKEIHHRVKNNLGIISSLLSLQADKIDAPEVVRALEDSQNRVYAMSMIHQKLYLGKNLATVEMKDYFMNLGNYILDSYGEHGRIRITYNMKPIEVVVDVAISLGLIVNELLTNALKHAFTKNRKGKIEISLTKTDEYTKRLLIFDDGIGYQNQKFNDTGFGMRLIDLLVQQLDGRIERSTENGAIIIIDFKEDNNSYYDNVSLIK